MPIVMTRSGEVISAPVLTPEQRNKLWEHVVRNWAKAHPEAFAEKEEKEP